jgi:hypothetical protein
MKNIIHVLIWTCLTGIGASELIAQNGPVVTGGDLSGANGHLSFSLGQVFYSFASGTEGNINQGLQQPYEVFIVDGVEEVGIQLSATVFPNPTANTVLLTIEHIELQDLKFDLYGLLGELIASDKIMQKETAIPMANLPGGTYFLRVYQHNKAMKVFKIIKSGQ